MTNYVDTWEYHVHRANYYRPLADFLPALGTQGWELVAVDAAGNGYFKRPTGEAVDTLENSKDTNHD